MILPSLVVLACIILFLIALDREGFAKLTKLFIRRMLKIKMQDFRNKFRDRLRWRRRR